MKAHIESSPRDLKQLAKIAGEGKVHKTKVPKPHKDTAESMEIKAYLNKLQELVPFIPKDRKLPKADIIHSTIRYINQLREKLSMEALSYAGGDNTCDFEMDPKFVTQTADEKNTTTVTLTVINGGDKRPTGNEASSLYLPSNRQPLGVISTTANNTRRICPESTDKVLDS